MPEEKPVTGSNEHFAQIEKQLAELSDIKTRLAAVSDSYHALVAENSRIVARLESLERVNPAG
jgi:regulator of replication initiation timing